MKYPLFFLTIAIFCTVNTYAQNIRKTDDALLLEYYQNQRFGDALSYLKSIYTEPVADAKELSRLAYTANMARLLPAAESYYQRMYDKDTTNQLVLYSLASINQRRGNNSKAEIYLKKLVLLDTANFSAFNRLGQLSKDKSDLKNALLYYEKANRINPTDADVAADLTEVCIFLNQTPKAYKVLAIAIDADPENVILQQTLLRLNYIDSKWKEVVKTGEQLLLLGDSTAATISKLGRGYFQTRNYTCGITILSKIPETEKTENTAYYTAACYKMLKDQKTAIVWFNKAIELSISSGTATYYNEIADSYETQKLFKKAQDNYLKGLLYDEQPIAYYYLATLFDSKLNNPKSAVKYYKKYVAAKPDEKQKAYREYAIARISALSVH